MFSTFRDDSDDDNDRDDAEDDDATAKKTWTFPWLADILARLVGAVGIAAWQPERHYDG